MCLQPRIYCTHAPLTVLKALVEMQLLLRSGYFLGSLGPFSATVAVVRDATLTNDRSNLRRRFPCE